MCGRNGEKVGRAGGLAGEFAFPIPGEENGDGEEGDDVEDHAADDGEDHGLHEFGAAAGGPEDGDEREERSGVGHDRGAAAAEAGVEDAGVDLGDVARGRLELFLDVGAEENAVVEHNAEEDDEADDDGGGEFGAPPPDEEETAGGGDAGVGDDDDAGDEPGARADVDEDDHHGERGGDDPAEGGVGLEFLFVAADPTEGGAAGEFELAGGERGAETGVGVADDFDFAAALGVEEDVLGAFAGFGADGHRADGGGEAGFAGALVDDGDGERGTRRRREGERGRGGEEGGERFAGGEGEFGASGGEDREVALVGEGEGGEELRGGSGGRRGGGDLRLQI